MYEPTIRASGQWIVCSGNSAARQRLICISHAGGGIATFSGWAKVFGSDVQVCSLQLPGRENRLRERPYERMSDLVSVAYRELLPFLDRRFSFFGHSLGGLIAFELARYLRSRLSQPENLFISSTRAPQLPYPFSRILGLPEDQFVTEVGRRYEAIPQEVLADEELRRITLRYLKADFSIFEGYEYTDAPALDSSIFALGGEEDRMVSRESLEAWRQQTRSSFALRMFPGGHFYFREQKPQLLAYLRDMLLRTSVG